MYDPLPLYYYKYHYYGIYKYNNYSINVMIIKNQLEFEDRIERKVRLCC